MPYYFQWLDFWRCYYQFEVQTNMFMSKKMFKGIVLSFLEWKIYSTLDICIHIIVSHRIFWYFLFLHWYKSDCQAKRYSKAEYVQCRVCFVKFESYLHEYMVCFVFARHGQSLFLSESQFFVLKNARKFT